MTDIAGPLAFTVDEVEKVILDRHRKYSATNIAQSPGGPLNGLRVRLFDKLARLSNYVDGGAEADFSDDSLRDCFIDIAGYGLIGLLVLDGNWPGATRLAPRDLEGVKKSPGLGRPPSCLMRPGPCPLCDAKPTALAFVPPF